MMQLMRLLAVIALLTVLVEQNVVFGYQAFTKSTPTGINKRVSTPARFIHVAYTNRILKSNGMLLRLSSSYDLSNTPEFLHHLQALRQRTTKELLDELKACNIPLPIVADRNDIEHLLALHRVKKTITSASSDGSAKHQRSKRAYNLALDRELKLISELDGSEITYLLLQINSITGDIIPDHCKDHELRVLLAKGLINMQDRDFTMYENLRKQIKQYLSPTSIDLENIFAEGEELLETAITGFKSTVQNLQGLGQSIIANAGIEVEEDADDIAAEILQDIQKMSKQQSKEKNGVLNRNEGKKSSSSSAIENMPFENDIEKHENRLKSMHDFDEVVQWGQNIPRDTLLFLIHRKGVQCSLQASRVTILNLLADAVMIENNEQQSDSPSLTSTSFIPPLQKPKVRNEPNKLEQEGTRKHYKSKAFDQFYPEKSFLKTFTSIVIPNFIVGIANLVEGSMNGAGDLLTKAMTISLDQESSHPLHKFENFMVSVTAGTMKILHLLASWASSGRMKSSTVLFTTSFYAILSKKGLNAFVGAVLGIKFFTMLLNSIAVKPGKKSKASNTLRGSVNNDANDIVDPNIDIDMSVN